MAWRAAVVSMLVGAILSFIEGLVVVQLGRPDLGGMIGGLLGWLGSFSVSIWALKVTLSKRHGEHTIVMIKST